MFENYYYYYIRILETICVQIICIKNSQEVNYLYQEKSSKLFVSKIVKKQIICLKTSQEANYLSQD